MGFNMRYELCGDWRVIVIFLIKRMEISIACDPTIPYQILWLLISLMDNKINRSFAIYFRHKLALLSNWR